jgi:hypothetical protein
VFGSAAIASFAAGAVLEYLGWEMVVVCTMFPVLLLAVLWVRLRAAPLPIYGTPDL